MSDESGTRILAFAGAKQSGKTTSCNFLHGYQLRAQEVVQNFGIEPTSGNLIVNTEILEDSGETVQGDTFLDVARRDSEFVEWAMYNMWPFVKRYSFADSLKNICKSLFGFSHEQCYGSNAYKDQIIPHLLWENMPGVCTNKHELAVDEEDEGYKLIYHKPGPMTAREFMQFFGTDVMRKMWEPIWVSRTLKDIEEERPLLAIIDDCRFESETLAIQGVGGKVIGYKRNPYDDPHSSEQDIKNCWDIFDSVIDNRNMEIHETCKQIIKTLGEWGWLGASTVTNGKKSVQTIKAN